MIAPEDRGKKMDVYLNKKTENHLPRKRFLDQRNVIAPEDRGKKMDVYLNKKTENHLPCKRFLGQRSGVRKREYVETFDSVPPNRLWRPHSLVEK